MNINYTRSLEKLLLSTKERRFGKAGLNKMKGKKSKTKGWVAKKGEDERREQKSGGLVRREERKEITGGGMNETE